MHQLNVHKKGFSRKYNIQLLIYTHTFAYLRIWYNQIKINKQTNTVYFGTGRRTNLQYITVQYLHDGEGGGGDGVGEVATGRGDGSHDGHCALSVGGAQALHPARALVESCSMSKRSVK